VAHIGGGELTEGAIDEAFRHSITKMSHLHFTAMEEYRKRVIQLGESQDRVFNVGALGLDNIKRVKLLSRTELEKKFALKLYKHNLLITFHPVTLEPGSSENQFKNLLGVLDELKDTALVFTKANADMDGRIINEMIDRYVSHHSNKAAAFTSMGQQGYLSAMKIADAVVGNSSSGIIEAPSFGIGTINIGDRQKGRVRAGSVIDCEPSRKSIRNAISELYSAEFQEGIRHVINPYGNGSAAKKIRNILRDYQINNILKKAFFDISFDGLVKSRHTREGGYPERKQLPEKTGFPFSPNSRCS
ncbi:MAG: UDP-N-acetylglucosamine 2-epimerase, partial [Dissulfurispiraceae bacterium]